jgi:hypothetical protein
MTSNLKTIDLAKSRFNNQPLEHVVANNLNLQSTNRALINDFKIPVKDVSVEYFLGDKFKRKFATYSTDEKSKICRLLGSLRNKELLETLETKE